MTFECNFHIVIHVIGLEIIFYISESTRSIIFSSLDAMFVLLAVFMPACGIKQVTYYCNMLHIGQTASRMRNETVKLKANQTINCHTWIKIVCHSIQSPCCLHTVCVCVCLSKNVSLARRSKRSANHFNFRANFFFLVK